MSTRATRDRRLRAGVVIVVAGSFVAALAVPALAATPSISSFNPTSGPVGTSVTIHGSDFIGANSVRFNGVSAGFSVNASGNQITATVPSGATTGPISVTTPEGTAQTGGNFIVTSGPTITSFNPTSGPVGTSVTINGTNLQDASTVRFNGASAGFNVNAAGTQITATVPSGATTGPISVTTPNGTVQSSGTFTVTSSGQAPNITSFSPTSGPVGTSVTINGTRFTGATSVRFNGVSASFSVVNDTRITATVPAGATKGKISVTTPSGTDLSSGNFTVTSTAVPKVSSFSPTSGAVGTTVTINGDLFTGANAVRFNGVSASFTLQNDNRLTAVVPAGATTGRISVTTSAGTGTSTSNFTVIGGGTHARQVFLNLSGRLIASGRVIANDGYQPCVSFVPVAIKRLRFGEWRWVTTTSTRQDGTYRAFIRNRTGTYRAKAKRVTLANGAICGGDRSNTEFYRR